MRSSLNMYCDALCHFNVWPDVTYSKCHVGWSSTGVKEKQPAKFNGPECATIMEHWDELVDIAIPMDFNHERNKVA